MSQAILSKDAATLHNDIVFNTSLTAVDTFQDLDLSAYVGVNAALCFFEISNDAVSNTYFAMKPKGYGSTGDKHTDNGAAGYRGDQNDIGYFVCMTNANGIVQISCSSNSVTWTVKLIGIIP